jgi:hypothetical protein
MLSSQRMKKAHSRVNPVNFLKTSSNFREPEWSKKEVVGSHVIRPGYANAQMDHK